MKTEIFWVTAALLGLVFLCQGNPSTQGIDRDGDGRMERRNFFWKGNRIREEVDGDQDGIMEIRRHYRNGKPVQLEIDSNHDRKGDVWLQYDADGKEAFYQADTNFDGRIDISKPYPFRSRKDNTPP
ncbi:MAG: hypothetical protein ABH845_02115 [Candidatus Omnitrophota bacterium]